MSGTRGEVHLNPEATTLRLLTYCTTTGTRAARVEGEDVHDLPFADVGVLLAAAATVPGGLEELAGPGRPFAAAG